MTRFATLFAALLLGGCMAPAEISVDDAWVRLGAVKGRPAAGYFTIHGGGTDTTLIAVTSDVSIRSEMHESMAQGGMMTMTPLAGVRVPAGEDVVFAPGGKHVMLYNVNPGIKPGGRPVLLTLSFADGTRVSRKANVVAAGNAATE